nr:amidase family protein [Streptomyces canus]
MLAGDPAVLEAARDADAQRASGADLGPLHGLPITLKDSYETAGLRTVCVGPISRTTCPTRTQRRYDDCVPQVR